MAATYGGVTYANGSVPAGILAPLDDQPYAQLRADAADAWNRARRAVIREADVMLTVRGWNRTLAEQEKFFLERYRLQASGDGPYDDVRWWNGRRYVRYGTAAAAIPGTSNHGWGLAVDVVDYGNVGQFDYPRRVRTFPILARHGWTDTEGRGTIQEPWHLVYDPTRDTHPQEDELATAKEIADEVWGRLVPKGAAVTSDQPAILILRHIVDQSTFAADRAKETKQLLIDLDVITPEQLDALAAKIAAGIPNELARRVIDELHARTAPADQP